MLEGATIFFAEGRKAFANLPEDNNVNITSARLDEMIAIFSS
jgi:hypothetical protein